MKTTTQYGTNTTENAGKKVDDAIETGRKYIDDVSSDYSKKFQEGFEVAKEKAQSATNEVNEWVQKRPLMALGIALGAGVVIGRIFANTTKKE